MASRRLLQVTRCELMGVGPRAWQLRRKKQVGSGRFGGGGVGIWWRMGWWRGRLSQGSRFWTWPSEGAVVRPVALRTVGSFGGCGWSKGWVASRGNQERTSSLPSAQSLMETREKEAWAAALVFLPPCLHLATEYRPCCTGKMDLYGIPDGRRMAPKSFVPCPSLFRQHQAGHHKCLPCCLWSVSFSMEF